MRIVVIGAGPAGLAAANAASESNAQVTLIDDNHSTGGQIWRGGSHPLRPTIRTLLGARVISTTHKEAFLESGSIAFDKLIVATGARELFLPFPGWTLPGVFGAGGLQALAKSGLDVTNKRIVVAGTGPLLLAVAHYLRTNGAKVLLVAEQAEWGRLLSFATKVPASKWREAIRLWTPRYSPATWVTEAHGANRLESVTLSSGRTIPCDYVAIGYGLVPNRELLDLLGSGADVLRAGEVTGIGGVELSILEGRIAGYTATENLEKVRALSPQLKRWQRFQLALNQAFALRPELKLLAKPNTFVCRCEDVTYAELSTKSSWREAKIHSRCGMGPCQGRICGPSLEFLFGWKPDSVRPPVFPAPVGSFSILKTK